MLRVFPVGLAAAPVANQLSLHVNLRKKLCRPYCIDSSIQPFSSVVYTAGTPILNGTTVFVPITARVTITVPGCGCYSKPQLLTEQFYVAFQGQTAAPTSVVIESVGRVENGADVHCGCAYSYSINDSLTITITPPAAPAAPTT